MNKNVRKLSYKYSNLTMFICCFDQAAGFCVAVLTKSSQLCWFGLGSLFSASTRLAALYSDHLPNHTSLLLRIHSHNNGLVYNPFFPWNIKNRLAYTSKLKGAAHVMWCKNKKWFIPSYHHHQNLFPCNASLCTSLLALPWWSGILVTAAVAAAGGFSALLFKSTRI